MNRSVFHQKIGDDEVRTSIRIEGEDCSPNTFEYRWYQTTLLRMMAETPELLNCGMEAFQKLRMYHDGGKWIIEAEATYKKG